MTPYLRNRPGSVPDAGTAGWMESAACRSIDPELFFPKKGGEIHSAVKICKACPVLAECLAHACDLQLRSVYVLHGVWAGRPQRWFTVSNCARTLREMKAVS
jgi:Transcription factor WhiB